MPLKNNPLIICFLILSFILPISQSSAANWSLPIQAVKFDRYSMGGTFFAEINGSIKIPNYLDVDLLTAEFVTISGSSSVEFSNLREEGGYRLVDFKTHIDSYTNAAKDANEIFQVRFPQSQLFLLTNIDSHAMLHFSIESTLRQMLSLARVPSNPVQIVVNGIAENENAKIETAIKTYLPKFLELLKKDGHLGFQSMYPDVKSSPLLQQFFNAISSTKIPAPQIVLNNSEGNYQKIFTLKNLEPLSQVAFYLPNRGWSTNVLVPKGQTELSVYLDPAFIYAPQSEIFVRMVTTNQEQSKISSVVGFSAPPISKLPTDPILEPTRDNAGFQVSNVKPGNQILFSKIIQPNFMIQSIPASAFTLPIQELTPFVVDLDGVYKAYQIDTEGFMSISSNYLFVNSGVVSN